MNEKQLTSLNTYTPQDSRLRNEISLIIESIFRFSRSPKSCRKVLKYGNGIIKAGDQTY